MKSRSLTFKFTLMFISFIIITLIVTSVLSYINQLQLYKSQREEESTYISTYLEELLISDGEVFTYYQDYFLENYKDLLVPHDFDLSEVKKSKQRYESLFASIFPGKVFRKDIPFEQFPKELKDAFAIYHHEEFLLRFEKARKDFKLIYLEYIVPVNEKDREVTFVLDSMRDEKIVDGKKYIELGITVPQPLEEHQKEWEAWESGKRAIGYDTFDNKYGKTYAYYSPLIINGRKLGLIGVEVEIAKVNKEILKATIDQMFMIGSVLVVFTLLLLFLIRTNYIRKLVILSKTIEEFSLSKNTKLAENLYAEVTNKDEISTIMGKFYDMIHELDIYIKNLTKAREDLENTQKQAIELSELATRDSLTGIRNKTAYDREVIKVKQEMQDGLDFIGVGMVDLNFLKKINDTYGHDKGNIAIIKLCKMICKTFVHSPVFRIGGDEFVIILRKPDLSQIDELLNSFHKQMNEQHKNKELEYWEKISAAIGYAIYNPSIDADYESIFKRADTEMYKNKKAMKAIRKE